MECFVPQTLPERFFAALSAIPRLSEYEAAAADAGRLYGAADERVPHG